MKKMVLGLLVLVGFGLSSQPVYGDTLAETSQVATLSSTIFQKIFYYYPPKTYNGRTLVHVVKKSNGVYVGWYI